MKSSNSTMSQLLLFAINHLRNLTEIELQALSKVAEYPDADSIAERSSKEETDEDDSFQAVANMLSDKNISAGLKYLLQQAITILIRKASRIELSHWILDKLTENHVSVELYAELLKLLQDKASEIYCFNLKQKHMDYTNKLLLQLARQINKIVIDVSSSEQSDLRAQDLLALQKSANSSAVTFMHLYKMQFAETPSERNDNFPDTISKKTSVAQFLTKLPRDLVELNLTLCEFNTMFKNDPGLTFKDIVIDRQIFPERLQKLGLRSSLIEFRDLEWQDMFSQLPDGLIALDLSANKLHQLSQEACVKLMSQLPKNLQQLDLSKNRIFKYNHTNVFHSYGKDQISSLVKALPPKLKTLILNQDDLVNLTEDEITAFITHLPSALEKLSLRRGDEWIISNGSLRSFSFEQMQAIVLGLDKSASKIKILEMGSAAFLGGNAFLGHDATPGETNENLKSFFRHLPQSIWRLDIVGHKKIDFSDSKMVTRMFELLLLVPAHVTTIKLFADEFARSNFLKIVEILNANKNLTPEQKNEIKHLLFINLRTDVDVFIKNYTDILNGTISLVDEKWQQFNELLAVAIETTSFLPDKSKAKICRLFSDNLLGQELNQFEGNTDEEKAKNKASAVKYYLDLASSFDGTSVEAAIKTMLKNALDSNNNNAKTSQGNMRFFVSKDKQEVEESNKKSENKDRREPKNN